MRLGSGSQILDNLSPFQLGKGMGQTSSTMVASCLVMMKLSNEGSEVTVNPTELFVSAGMLMQPFADESIWKKNSIFYFLLLLEPSNAKSLNSVKS